MTWHPAMSDPAASDHTVVTALLGRPPQGDFEVCVRSDDGRPVVIRNAPLLDDGTPMPTRYWLVDENLRRAVSRLEAAGGVRRAETEVDADELARAHSAYAADRDAAVPADHSGPAPSGGVGGTRKGVKCLHAHYAWHLVGGDDPVGRWVAARLDQRYSAPVTGAPALAAIDCGTNSTRLLVTDEGGATLERLMHITRLGQGVDATGRLADGAIARTVAVLKEYRGVMDRHGVSRVRMTATSAARDAANRDAFFEASAAAVGVQPELLTGDEEARLSFLGATTELDPADGPFLVVDIGGGSTEFAAGTTEPEGVLSVDIGCVRLTEKFLHHDPPAPEELSQVVSVARDYMEDVAREVPGASEARTLVGLAGTVTTVAAIELGLKEYERERIHHFVLTRAAVEDVFRTLATESRAQRLHNPGLEEARADVIVAGTAILVALMRYFEKDECLVSEADILDGLVSSLRGAT